MTIETVPAQATATHGTFTLERTYPFDRATVFGAWATRNAKSQWFGEGDDFLAQTERYELDFRVGGREINRVGPKGGPVHAYDARYMDIVPNQRIVFGYDMHLDDTRISVSLATVEFAPAGAGTRLSFTEQVVFLDGYDDPAGREHGTRIGLAKLDAALRRETRAGAGMTPK